MSAHRRRRCAWRTVLGVLLFVTAPMRAVTAQASSVTTWPAVRVDSTGTLRWLDSGREVALFGVNYTAPFAYAHRAMTRLGVDHRRAIDADVAHLARLGVDAFRIHVWDREVSDRAGNLVENEHLALLDYLLAKLADRGIRTMLTPIGWWGTGWPEPDPQTSGFSTYFSKGQMSVDAVARAAQVRFLEQFVQHVNPLRRRAYRDDPAIIAWEIFNEPQHAGTPAELTRYINTLAHAMRDAGVKTPIFYNISEHYTDANAVATCAADVQGVSAQWYPTGLMRGAALPGSPLPNVDRFPVPWARFSGCRNKARMVYEFDGADVGAPLMYPAMARAFRAAGFQWATQFAYDPMAIAYSNTEYQTHFLNLAYTPAKAVAFAIAGAAFRSRPRFADTLSYVTGRWFGDFRVRYETRTSEWVSDTVFMHAGTTRSNPPRPEALRRLAGVGSSSLVTYDGSGAWFLDRLAPGVWRLEVYPDADSVADPYTKGSLARAVTRIAWRTHTLSLALPDLGLSFTATPLDAKNTHTPTVRGGALDVRPGVYLLTRAGATVPNPLPRVGALASLDAREFAAPAPTPDSLVPAPVLRAEGAAAPGVLFDAVRDSSRIILPGYHPGVEWLSGFASAADSGRTAFSFAVQRFVVGVEPFGVRVALDGVPDAVVRRRARSLVVHARAPAASGTTAQVALVERDGTAWGATITLDDAWRDIAVPLTALRRVPLVLLPRPYPTFLPYTFTAPSTHRAPRLDQLDGVQIGLMAPPGATSAAMLVTRVSLR